MEGRCLREARRQRLPGVSLRDTVPTKTAEGNRVTKPNKHGNLCLLGLRNFLIRCYSAYVVGTIIRDSFSVPYLFFPVPPHGRIDFVP
jgi:hypothetical protein